MGHQVLPVYISVFLDTFILISFSWAIRPVQCFSNESDRCGQKASRSTWFLVSHAARSLKFFVFIDNYTRRRTFEVFASVQPVKSSQDIFSPAPYEYPEIFGVMHSGGGSAYSKSSLSSITGRNRKYNTFTFLSCRSEFSSFQFSSVMTEQNGPNSQTGTRKP